MPESSSSSIFEQVSVLVTDSHLFCLEDVSPIIQASLHIAVYTSTGCLVKIPVMGSPLLLQVHALSPNEH